MGCLCDSDEIYGASGKWGCFGRGGFITNVRVKAGCLDLCCARVGAENAIKVLCQMKGCLATPGSAIPSELLRGTKAGQVVKEG